MGGAFHYQGFDWRDPAQKLTSLSAVAVAYGQHPAMRLAALRILREAGVHRSADGGAGQRQAAEALCAWVRDRVGFHGEAGEQILTPPVTIGVGGGDCDDQAVLLGALLTSVRLPWGWLIWTRRGAPQSHISVGLRAGGGEWLNLDPTASFGAGGSPQGWTRTAVPVDPDRGPAFGQAEQAAEPYWTPAEKVAYGIASLIGTSVGLYHGTRRNGGRVRWGLWWGFWGGALPIVVIPLALAQGLGRPK